MGRCAGRPTVTTTERLYICSEVPAHRDKRSPKRYAVDYYFISPLSGYLECAELIFDLLGGIVAPRHYRSPQTQP